MHRPFLSCHTRIWERSKSLQIGLKDSIYKVMFFLKSLYGQVWAVSGKGGRETPSPFGRGVTGHGPPVPVGMTGGEARVTLLFGTVDPQRRPTISILTPTVGSHTRLEPLLRTKDFPLKFRQSVSFTDRGTGGDEVSCPETKVHP